jgi:transcriptional regulator GlxA family with amidase domain
LIFTGLAIMILWAKTKSYGREQNTTANLAGPAIESDRRGIIVVDEISTAFLVAWTGFLNASRVAIFWKEHA